VSLLFPERHLIGLAPAEVSLGKRKLACDPEFGAQPWQGAIHALKNLDLAGKVTVVLSNHFVRYALVPWSGALSSPQEEDAYVRHHFVKIHGERAKSWVFRATGASSRLCSAIDQDLLEELRACFAKHRKAKLVSVQPALMAAFNRWRGSIPASGAWLVLVEPGRACVGLHAQGHWQSVQNAKGEWRAALERERHRAPGAVPELVLKLEHLPA